MKLFGKKKKQQTDKTAVTIEPDASLTFESQEKDVIPQEQAEQLVLSFEGMEPRREEEKMQALRGATKTLPDQNEIARAVAEVNAEARMTEQNELTEDLAITEEPAIKKRFEIALESEIPEKPEHTEVFDLKNDPEIAGSLKIAEEPVIDKIPEIIEAPVIDEAPVEPETMAEALAEAVAPVEAEAAEEDAPEIVEAPVEPETMAEALAEAVAPAEAEASEQAEEAAEASEETEKPEEEQTLSAVSYASMAQAVVNAKKEPTGRFSRDAIDDDTLLAELYALIGDPTPKKAPVTAESPEPETVQPAPAPRPVTRITQEALQDAPDYVELEEDNSGVPGWLKGAFILLISLLLSAMTFYAVATDVIGKIF